MKVSRFFVCSLACVSLYLLAYGARPQDTDQKHAANAKPTFDYTAAADHEIEPHRRTIPMKGVEEGFNQLRLTLIVSANGEVLDAKATGDDKSMRFWPRLEGEVRGWKYLPFEKSGSPVTAEIEEYIDLVPPERFPKKHVIPPSIRPDSKIAISLSRSGCFGTCPSYSVTIKTNGIEFNGGGNVVAQGRHTDTVDPQAVRTLAKKFTAADFYSMDEEYRAGVTDNPTYELSIVIDGREKKVEDYVGEWVGMPAVISQLEREVDEFARSSRWIRGTEGMVSALQAENFDFHTFDAQVMLKQAILQGKMETVQELLQAGVPLDPLPVPVPKHAYEGVPFANIGFLTAAAAEPDVLSALISAGASRSNQQDKDLALVGASRAGKLSSVRALIDYGADPNANMEKLTVTENPAGWMTLEGPGAGSILIYAAESGNPEVLREILRYHPKLEARDRNGRTAMFAAVEYRNGDEDGARVECVRLLAEAGLDVNARDRNGNTPLHETFLTDVEEELLKLGANVNARNADGETPIFTTVDDEAIPLFIAHGADLSIRNNKGETVVDAAKTRGPARQEALRKALSQIVKQ